jgi:hypothetical protein
MDIDSSTAHRHTHAGANQHGPATIGHSLINQRTNRHAKCDRVSHSIMAFQSLG